MALQCRAVVGHRQCCPAASGANLVGLFEQGGAGVLYCVFSSCYEALPELQGRTAMLEESSLEQAGAAAKPPFPRMLLVCGAPWPAWAACTRQRHRNGCAAPALHNQDPRRQSISECGVYREQHLLEKSSLEAGGAHKAVFPEGAPSTRQALARLSLERHSLKAVHEEDDPDVQQVEMLLQAYFIQMDNIFNQLATMNEYISDTEVWMLLCLAALPGLLCFQHMGFQAAAGVCCLDLCVSCRSTSTWKLIITETT